MSGSPFVIEEQTRRGVRARESEWESEGFGLFAVELRSIGELAGFTGLSVPGFLPEVLPAVEAEAAMEGDRAAVPDRCDRLQPLCAMALRCFGERRVETAPETGATGVVPGGDQMRAPGAVRRDEPEDIPTDSVLGTGDQAGGTELPHQRQEMQRPEIAVAPVTGVIRQDPVEVGHPGRCDAYIHDGDDGRRRQPGRAAGEYLTAIGRVWFAVGVTQDLETVAFPSAEAFEAWLGENHAVSSGIWLKLRKKGPGIVALDYAQALDTALCYGWIDGQKAKFDDQWWLQRFTPRTPRSKWSKINRNKVAALVAQGRMRPPGQAEIDRAKSDGRWEAAYDSPKTATVPDDLIAALSAAPAAAEFFDQLDRQSRYAILYRVQDAKKPETRARRIEKYVTMLAKGEKLRP